LSEQEEQLVLVDEDNREVGVMNKLEAHKRGLLHRAISVFVFDAEGKLILQRRAAGKYHSGGQWANTCCSHPRPGESAQDAAHRRLFEELGFDCDLAYRMRIRYQAAVGSGLIENELVSVYVGDHDGELAPDPQEVSEWRAVRTEDLSREIEAAPDLFTPWLRIYVRDHADVLFGRKPASDSDRG
jgi:isopentenyl-diphosphate delta-isomerase